MKTRSNSSSLTSTLKNQGKSQEKANYEESDSTNESHSTKFLLLKPKHRRSRKSWQQIKQLKQEFHSNPTWTKEQVQELSCRTGLSEAQVYKWGWDYRKKLRLDGFWEDDIDFLCEEILYPSSLENSMWGIWRLYKQCMAESYKGSMLMI